MTNTDFKENEFTNDRLADMILHKDDDHIAEENEAFDETADPLGGTETEEPEIFKAPDNDGAACWFPIHFSYQGIDHTADVKRLQTPLAEYHVFDVIPTIDHLPEPFVIAEHFSKEKYDFPVNEMYYPITFGTTLLNVINEGSNDRLHLPSFEEDL